MQEIWIEYIPKYYSVSNLGRVRSLDRFIFEKGRDVYCKRKGKLLLVDTSTGYARVNIKINGDSFHKEVHRMVAELFIPNPTQAPIINHIDGNKLNNLVENLEWVTYKENTTHCLILCLQTHDSKLTDLDILEIRELIEMGCSNSEIAKLYNVHRSSIYNIKSGKRKTTTERLAKY
jgi:hypothetical protein